MSLSILAFGIAANLLLSQTGQTEKENVSDRMEFLRVVTDGKKHFVVFDNEKRQAGPIFYGDDKEVYLQRVYGGGASGDTQFDAYYWEPRFPRGQVSFDYKDGAYSVTCGKRTTALTLLPAEESKSYLSKVNFYKTRWKYQAHSLSRDDRGVYYYVDMMREDFGKERRIFVGQRGAMKALKMTNVVADSMGEIYSTKSGEYRLVSGKGVAKWVVGKKSLNLVSVPVEDNVQLIYSELGVYDRERLGTPCDDL